jgi:hypothetical protein
MATPSIVLVPDRFKSGVLYSQLPESGAVDFDVTRATTAFRTNASGILESVASGVPRLDYPAAGGCPSLLVEPAATNLLLRSEEFDNASWVAAIAGTGVNPIITANAGVAPNGTSTADQIVFNSGGTTSGAQSFLTQTFTRIISTNYTSAIYLKGSVGGEQLVLRHAGASSYLLITLTNEWQRISRTELAPLGTTGVLEIGIRQGLGGIGTINTTATIFAWGAQLEVGSVATSYIPTVAATATRNADVISKTGVSGFIGQAQGTLYAEVDVMNLFTGRVLAIDTGTLANFINIIKESTSTFRVALRKNTGSIVNIITGAVGVAGINKVALSYADGDYKFYLNGSLAGTSSNSTDYPSGTLSRVVISNTDYGPLNDRIRAAAIYPTRLSNAELAALTSL